MNAIYFIIIIIFFFLFFKQGRHSFESNPGCAVLMEARRVQRILPLESFPG